MRIIRSKTPNTIFNKEAGENLTPPKIFLNIQPETLEVKVSVNKDGEYKEIFWCEMSLQTLKASKGFCDQSVWTIVESCYPLLDSDGNNTHHPVCAPMVIDLLAETLVSKKQGYSQESGFFYTPFGIFVEDSEGDFTDFTYVIKDSDDVDYIVEGPSAQHVTSETVRFTRDLIAPVTLSSTQSSVGVDSSITIDVSSSPTVKEVYLEQVYGIPNKLRVPLTNGSGSFKLLTTGMDVGDLVRVKAGHRKYTGIADFTITIS
jgi:hypothetical protein